MKPDISVPPRVSVIITTRNRVTYLRYALDSVLAQTFRDFEVIVVDDGSTDSTPEVIAGYGVQLRYLRLEGGGRSEARNAGVAASTGEFVAFLDDDDAWAPEKLKRQVTLLDENRDIGLVHTFTQIIDEEGRVVPDETRRRTAYHLKGLQATYTYEGMARLCIMFISSVLVRRTVLDRAGRFDSSTEALEDWDLYLRIARTDRLATLEEALTFYRLHLANTDQTLFVRGRIGTAEKHLRLLAQEPSDANRDRCRILFLLHLARASYIAGDRGKTRTYTAKALRLNPREVLRTRLPLHFLICLAPESLFRRLHGRIGTTT